MIQLIPISAKEILQLPEVEKLFPMTTQDYLKRDDYYFQDKFEWFLVTDDKYKNESERKTILAIICVTDEWFEKLENDFHLSVFEVATPIRNIGIGTRILDSLIDLAIKYHYNTMSLQVREKGLIPFYTRFGFHEEFAYPDFSCFILNIK